MMRNLLQRDRVACFPRRLFLSVVIGAFVFLGASALAQESGQSPSGQNSSAGSAVSSAPVTMNGQLVEDSREAAGEDDQAQFKHSASVQYIAKLTGMSLEHAYWLGVLINFGIIAGIIVWLSGKHLPPAFRNRTASIQKAMEEARRASEDAHRRLGEIEARLSMLDSEISGMRANAEKESAAEEARIKAAAEGDARRIVESAEQEIAAAAKSARRDLTAYAADLAVTLATKRIQVDDPTDQALVRGFAKQLTGKDRPQ